MAGKHPRVKAAARLRQRTEERWRENWARLERSLALAQIGSWDLDLVARQLHWSDEVYRLFNVRPQEFEATYEAFLSFVHPEDRAAVDAAYSNSLREGQDGYAIEHRIVRHATGEIRSVFEKCEHLRDASGRVVRSFGMVQDVTERKQADETLRKLSRAMEQGPASIVITDLLGNIEYVNPKFSEITGYSFEEALGKNPRILKSGHTSAAEYRKMWRTLLSGKVWKGEFLNQKKNGEMYWEAATLAPIFSKAGEITNFLALKENITERKRVLLGAQRERRAAPRHPPGGPGRFLADGRGGAPPGNQ